jgi:guanine deaminase
MPPAPTSGITAIRGPALTSTGNPFRDGIEGSRRFESDAVVAMRGGRIHAFGPADQVLPTLPADTPVERYAGHLIIPGFIDAHVHYPQTSIVAAWGGGLLDWLERHAFPAEERFADPAWAREVAGVFLDECLRHGITTAMVYGTVHAGSVDALLEAASARSMRLIAGKVLMDRNAPAALLDGGDLGIPVTRELITRWHGRGRLALAVTPRFAASSTRAQLEAAGALLGEHPDLRVQTHLSENTAEIRWVRDLFPDARDYLDVYEQAGLVGPRTVLGHGIHLSDDELRRIHERGASIAHCPTSNLFLGSGLFDLFRAQQAERPVKVGLATDIGAGTTFSVLRTLGEAYKVAQLRGQALSPAHAFWLATQGSAEALSLDDRIGRLAPGMEADLVVLDLRSTPLLEWRMRQVESMDDAFFLQMMLADERAIRATFVDGKLVYSRPS